MQISLILAQQIAELFLILLIGCVLVKARLLKSADSRVLSVVMVYAVMPCVIINAFQVDYSPPLLPDCCTPLRWRLRCTRCFFCWRGCCAVRCGWM